MGLWRKRQSNGESSENRNPKDTNTRHSQTLNAQFVQVFQQKLHCTTWKMTQKSFLNQRITFNISLAAHGK